MAPKKSSSVRSTKGKPQAKSSSSAGVTEKQTLGEAIRGLPALFIKSMAFKMYEVEEPVDFYWHRPLAAVLTVAVYYWPWVITPNQITLMGLFLGWIAAWFLYATTFPSVLVPAYCTPTQAWYVSSLFLWAWATSDCSDGQVARLLKRGTRLGRIIDGTVDVMVLVPNILIMDMIAYHTYGVWWGRLTAVAGLSLVMHVGLYDQMKNTYMEYSLPNSETSGESAATVKLEYQQHRKKYGCGMETALLGWYYVYLTRQELQFGGKVESRALGSSTKSESSSKRQQIYRQRHAGTVRLASFLGISEHVMPMYLTWLFVPSFPSAFPLLVLFLAVPMNVLHVLCVFRFKEMLP